MQTEPVAPHCPLCGGEKARPFFADRTRSYLRCPRCTLVFVPRRHWLGAAAEKAVYDLHQNDPLDQGYRKFLARLGRPLLDRLQPGQRGLDFGCGPGPALPLLFEEAGYRVERFDPFYANHPEVLGTTYDFICATEVVEHLHDPQREFERLFALLKPGGWLGIMTKLVSSPQAFRRWHYIRDPTHVCFYSRRSFDYIARRFNAEVEFIASDVILLNRR